MYVAVLLRAMEAFLEEASGINVCSIMNYIPNIIDVFAKYPIIVLQYNPWISYIYRVTTHFY